MNILLFLLIGFLEMVSGGLIAAFLSVRMSPFWRGFFTPVLALWLVMIGPMGTLGMLSLAIGCFVSFLFNSGKLILA